MKSKKSRVLLVLGLLCASETRAVAEPPVAAATIAEWPMAGKNYANTRRSELRAIDTRNVSKLKLQWSHRTGIPYGHEGAPIVVGATMYLTTPFPNRLLALDIAAGGRTRWIYDPNPEPAAQGVACCDVVNRGAVYADGKIVFNTLDAHTIAVDADSGRELWKTKLGEYTRGETMTMAPLVVRDRVFVGNSGGEFGVRGWLTALDLNNGSIVWRAYNTGPDRDALIGPSFRPHYAADRGSDLGVTTWPPDKWLMGGGTVWGFLSYDPALDLIYYGTGNPGPWNHEQRAGDNKWTCGVFARTPSTGEAQWFYQWSPHDRYDYDGINENILAELELDGVQRRVLLNAGRTGYVYVLDRATGEVLSATPFTHVTNSRGVDLRTGRLQMASNKEAPQGRAIRGICPAAPGGKDWQPAAFSSATGLLYIPANNLCQDEQSYEANYIAGTPYLGKNVRMYAGPGGHRGELVGWNVRERRAEFRVREPAGVWSGVLVTDGDLVFYGTLDGWFKAVHARTGALLWQQQLHSGIVGQPVTYRAPDGRQYVSVFAGVGGWIGRTVSGQLDPRDATAALGTQGATGDLRARQPAAGKLEEEGGVLYTFAVP